MEVLPGKSVDTDADFIWNKRFCVQKKERDDKSVYCRKETSHDDN